MPQRRHWTFCQISLMSIGQGITNDNLKLSKRKMHFDTCLIYHKVFFLLHHLSYYVECCDVMWTQPIENSKNVCSCKSQTSSNYYDTKSFLQIFSCNVLWQNKRLDLILTYAVHQTQSYHLLQILKPLGNTLLCNLLSCLVFVRSQIWNLQLAEWLML